VLNNVKEFLPHFPQEEKLTEAGKGSCPLCVTVGNPGVLPGETGLGLCLEKLHSAAPPSLLFVQRVLTKGTFLPGKF
jgi:hypothetical protein